MERLSNRSFKWLMILGPFFILGITYLFLFSTTSKKKEWNVLIMDKNEIFDGKLTASRPQNLSFDFINTFVEYEDFANDEKYKKYDLAVQINEKIVSNKHVIISYKEYPPENIQRHLVYYVERRLEEIMVQQFTDLSVEKFRDIKQSLRFNLKNAYDPRNEKSTIKD